MDQCPSISPQIGCEKINILVVDDQPAKLLSYEVILSGIGATLIKASSACEAFECLLKSDVALILIDVCMPEIDGFELATLIREHPRFQRVAIIFVSALMHGDLDKLRGYALGAVDYIPVPLAPELLRAKVKVFVELHQKTRQLESLNAELERKVIKRTDDLRRRNEDLEKRIEERTREREALLAQRYEAQQVDTVSQVGGVVHDFNNLLMAVLGSLSLLEKKLPEDPQALHLLRNASQAARRGATLTRDLLAFSRRREFTPGPVDVGDAVSGMQNLLEHALGFSIRLSCQFTQTLPTAFVDANQLQLALLNMAIGVRDAMPCGGRVVISSTAVSKDSADSAPALPPGDYVRIRMVAIAASVAEITDTALNKSVLAEPSPSGTSLGFSIAQAMATRFGGLLALVSAPNAVTSADLWLPRAGLTAEWRSCARESHESHASVTKM
ncbi:MAG TPA: response regulator [Steroidobacteraceae bacterium]|nr:response regulator [Steroidobacteraceae bacterium]